MVFKIETQDWGWMKGVLGVEIVVLERWRVLCENKTVLLIGQTKGKHGFYRIGFIVSLF